MQSTEPTQNGLRMNKLREFTVPKIRLRLLAVEFSHTAPTPTALQTRRSGGSLPISPSFLELRSALSGTCAPWSEPTASEPPETKALPPVVVGSLKRSQAVGHSILNPLGERP
jgi:hypothetical protein